jgi:hypothetical protein
MQPTSSLVSLLWWQVAVSLRMRAGLLFTLKSCVHTAATPDAVQWPNALPLVDMPSEVNDGFVNTVRPILRLEGGIALCTEGVRGGPSEKRETLNTLLCNTWNCR